jgi:transposase
MSLRPQAVYVVPEDTARVARAAFPKGNPYLLMHDELGRLYTDQDFAALFPALGQPALAPAQLALVTLMPFAEHLTDRQAAEAVRARIDWKYALCLDLDDAGFDYSVLCEFRARLLGTGQEALLFERLLARCREAGLVRARGRQRTDRPLSWRRSGHSTGWSWSTRPCATRCTPWRRSCPTGCGRPARPSGRSATSGGWRTIAAP